MKTKFILSIVCSVALSACSGGGGGGSAGSASGQATGPFSIPNATCGGQACIGGASLMATSVHTSALTSGTTVFNIANLVYSYFTDTVIPQINTALYKVEQVAAENDLNTCQDIEGVTAGTLDYPLGDGYTVDVSDTSTDLDTIPANMTDSGSKTSRRFIFKNSGSPFAEVQIKCNSTTERTLYVRLQESATRAYEFWAQVDGDKRVLYGAMDDGSSQKITFYFNTADGNSFQLHGVGKQVTVAGAVMDLAIAGGANLTAGTADIAYVQDGTVPTTKSYSDDDSSVKERHCYSAISPLTVDSAATAATTCSGLLSPASSYNAIRSGTEWSTLGMSTAISTSF